MDRQTFAERSEMTSNWYEQVKKREGNVEAYIGKRHTAYLKRWKEAARFIENGSKVLDVGGGNLYPALLEYILNKKQIDYFYIDVDRDAVTESREAGRGPGMQRESVFIRV